MKYLFKKKSNTAPGRRDVMHTQRRITRISVFSLRGRIQILKKNSIYRENIRKNVGI